MDPVKIIKNQEYPAAALDILNQAKRRVDICTYKFEYRSRPSARELNSLINRLYELAAAGRKIRVLLNTTGARSGLTKINEHAAKILKGHGIEVRTLPDGRCQHAKMLLVDGCLAIIGSHNWSPKSLTENFEISVAFYGAQYLGEIEKHFEKIWEGSKKL